MVSCHSFDLSGWLLSKTKQTNKHSHKVASIGKDVEELEPLYTVGERVK